MDQTNSAKTHKQYIAALIATGAQLVAGMSFSWSSPVEIQIVADASGQCSHSFCVSKESFTWITTSVSIGCVLSGFSAGPVMSAFGRKFALLGYFSIMFIGWLVLTFASAEWMLYLGRLLIGIGYGSCAAIVSVYVGEISQISIRGNLLAIYQISLQIGILISAILGYCLAMMSHTVVATVVAAIYGVALCFIPESPRYLVYNNRLNDALRSLAWLRGTHFNPDSEIKEMTEFQNSQEHKGVKTLLTNRTNRKALLISFGLMAAFNLCGASTLIFYAAGIFKDANISISPNLAVVVISCLSLLGCTIASFLVDRLGRRLILMLSYLVLFGCHFTFGTYFYFNAFFPEIVENIRILPVFILGLMEFLHAFGVASVSFILVSEIFAQNVKDTGAGFAMMISHILAIVASLLFPYISGNFGSYVAFYMFGVITFLAFIFVLAYVPETKGKSFLEIQKSLIKST